MPHFLFRLAGTRNQKRRKPVDILVRKHDAPPNGYRGVLENVRITVRLREKKVHASKPAFFLCKFGV
jgi:hypothetical protein